MIIPVELHHVDCVFFNFALSVLKQQPIFRFLTNMKILQPMYLLIKKLGDLWPYNLSLKSHPFIQLNKWAPI